MLHNLNWLATGLQVSIVLWIWVNVQETMINRIKYNTATPFDSKYKQVNNLPE